MARSLSRPLLTPTQSRATPLGQHQFIASLKSLRLTEGDATEGEDSLECLVLLDANMAAVAVIAEVEGHRDLLACGRVAFGETQLRRHTGGKRGLGFEEVQGDIVLAELLVCLSDGTLEPVVDVGEEVEVLGGGSHVYRSRECGSVWGVSFRVAA